VPEGPHDVDRPWEARREARARAARPPVSRARVVAGTLVLLALLGGCVAAVGRGGTTGGGGPDDAWAACSYAMAQRLDSPTSAVFPELAQVTYSGSEPAGYDFSGWVDARGGGALRDRVAFTCRASRRADGWYAAVTPVSP